VTPRERRLAAASTLIGLLLALLLGEGVLRGYEAWQRERPPAAGAALALLRDNPRGTGSYRLEPNLDLATSVEGRPVTVRTNSHGMRSREVAQGKPAGINRVAFLGDSFTLGCWSSSSERSFVGVFEKSLSPRRWEVLNFGVGGFGLADEELLLQEEVVGFAPDYVVIVIFNGNDFRDTFLGRDKAKIVDGTAQLQDAVVRARVPASSLDPDTTLARLRPAGAWSRLALGRFLAPWLHAQPLAVDFAVNRNFTMFGYWSQFPYPPVALAARDATLATLARIEESLAAHGSRLALVTLPFMEQAYASELAGPGYDVAFPQVYVQTFARERNIPYLDLLPVFRAHVQAHNERLYLRKDIHLNDVGHRLAGEAIAAWFQSCVRRSATPAPDQP